MYFWGWGRLGRMARAIPSIAPTISTAAPAKMATVRYWCRKADTALTVLKRRAECQEHPGPPANWGHLITSEVLKCPQFGFGRGPGWSGQDAEEGGVAGEV